MVERVLIDNLKLKSRSIAEFWREMVRSSEQLKHFNELDDQRLVDINAGLYPVLARALERGLEKNSVGSYFATFGKNCARAGLPLSETLLTLNLAQKVVVEYLMTECVVDSSMEMYQVIAIMARMSDFFLLGSFYLTKGFLEDTYVNLNAKESLSSEVLSRYFRDDFFFK